MSVPKTIEWIGDVDGHIRMIDQTLLPGELRMIDCRDLPTVWEAIKMLRVRGAPALGVTAAMAVVLGVQGAGQEEAAFFSKLDEACAHIATSRPTAVNLFWALDRMKRLAASLRGEPVEEIRRRLLDEAQAIRDEDAAMCRAIGEAGEHLIKEGMGVLTHCNAGGLATAEYGTALAPMYVAHERGRGFRVYADETRPLLQGARLTAWELQGAGIDVTVICDNMAACVMAAGKIDLVITGADRIAGNGDTANKVGTYGVATLARAHGIPFYVAAPSSTFDLSISSGAEIPIEHRDPREVACGFGQRTVPGNVPCYNQAFDVTPVELIAGFVTERGLMATGTGQKIADFLA
ncbi:MAG: S-methyl-5-thioribose-1-phosphate isomerase [Phycisphaerae bacterium]|nr:S-methyl-5-thioribose-1-phosphate isomerase [Phycisphaerae bacterium]